MKEELSSIEMRRLELHEAYTHLMLLETKPAQIILTLTSGEQKF